MQEPRNHQQNQAAELLRGVERAHPGRDEARHHGHDQGVASQGAGALEGWLEDRGVKNIQALNAVLRQGARPWWDAYGGRQNIEIT